MVSLRNEDAERAILNLIFIDGPTALNRIREVLTPDDFTAINGDIYETICRQADQNKNFDVVTIWDVMKNHPGIDRVYLTNLANAYSVPNNLEEYINIVKKCSIARQKINNLEEQKKKILEGEDPQEVISAGLIADMDILKANKRDRVKHISEVIQETYDEIGNRINRDFIGIPTEIGPLDKLIGGLIPDCVLTIAGRPGTGKTTLSQQIALNVSKNYYGCVCSLEMSRQRLGVKFLANESGINSRILNTPKKLIETQWKKLSQALGTLGDRKLYIDDSTDMKASQIAVRMRKLAAEVDLKYIIIDYVQIVQSEETKGKSRDERISDTFQIFKNLARELNITVIVLSQLNREIERRQEPKPTLADLRESGSIEAMSDIVLFLYKDKASEEKTQELNHEDWIITPVNIAKNKYGPPDVTIDLIFARDLSKFIPVETRFNQKINTTQCI